MSNTTPEIVNDVKASRSVIETRFAVERSWFIALGILLMLVGLAAISFPLAGFLAIDVIIATAFIAAGVLYLAHAFGTQSRSGFAWQIVLGLMYLAAGGFLYLQPIEGAVVLTAAIAISLIADGIVRAAMSIAMRTGLWGWLLASGILSIVLGLAVFSMSAGQAVLLFGVLVGINLLVSGMAFVIVAMFAGAGVNDETPA